MFDPKLFIHESWDPIKYMLYAEPLKSLSERLPEMSFNPQQKDIFKVFSMPVRDIKVVILGQDPYPNPKYANGYAFAIPDGVENPSSLNAIKAEVHSSVNGNADLMKWVDQGVLLLNTALTVERGKPGSHLNYWRPFMQRVISFISHHNPSVWMLWGSHAQSYRHYIRNRFAVKGYSRKTISLLPIGNRDNQVLDAGHPASEAYGNGRFLGCDHFYFANAILTKKRIQNITW